MLKISFILMLSIALCLADLPKLRNEISLRPIQVIELLGDALGYTLPGSESDYLNELAQSLAEHHGNAISFIDNYPKSKYTAPVLTFGFKLRGDVTFKTLLLNDSTGKFYFHFIILKINSNMYS